MTRLEIDGVNKTIKFKDPIMLVDIPRILGEILVNWHEYTLVPHDGYTLTYTNPYHQLTPYCTTNNNSAPYTTFDGPTKL